MNVTKGSMTPKQIGILQHALGVDRYGMTPKGYTPYVRNYFCAGMDDESVCRELVDLGYMVQHETRADLPYFNCSVTKEGIKAMHLHSAKPNNLTASQKRFQEYLDFAESFDCTFRQFLDIRKTYWYKEEVEK